MNAIDRGRAVLGKLGALDSRAFWAEFTKRKSGGERVDHQVIADIFSHYPELSSHDVEDAVAYGYFADR